MIELLLSLPTWAGCIVAMGFTTVAGFVVYLVFYKFISKYQRGDMKEPTNNLFRVVGTLVSLMLALAFSEVIVLVTLYTVFVGLVLYLILALSDPFQGDISVAPTAFEYLVETLQSEIR